MYKSKKTNLNRNVTCLIVTYADRRDLLQQVIRRISVLQPAVDSIILVFNGVPYDPNEFIDEFKVGPPLKTLVFDKNMGSAHGYAGALEFASHLTTTDYFWLLDDDNLPDEHALHYFELTLGLLDDNIDCLLLAVRENRWEYMNAVHTGQRLYMKYNAFFGFHLGSMFLKKVTQSQPLRISKQAHVPYPLMEVGYGPYGGLLMHRQWIERVGLPDKNFFVYEDDREYTDRIVHSGGTIYLCAASKIQDIENSWFENSVGRSHYLVDPNGSSERAFFVFRNRTYLESKRYVNSQILYKLNAAVFALRIVVSGYRHWLNQRFWMRLHLLAVAYREGRSGSLRAMSDELAHWINHHG